MFEVLLHTALNHLVRDGALRVTNASGTTSHYGDGTGPRVAVRFTSHRWQRAVVLDPELRLGEAYMDGGLVVDEGSMADLLQLLVRNTALREPTFLTALFRRLRTWIRTLRSNTPLRASRNARHHYNVDHRIYRLFLDSDMQYSCAYFTHPDATLEEAQEAKKRHIAAKLFLNEPNLKVLDIGSGWGGLGLHLARTHAARVLGINLSDEQVKIAQERAKAEALPCEFQIQDYRALDDTFDRIVSVGMFEHVGKRHYDTYFRKCFSMLADNGVMLLHTVGRWDAPSITNPWIWRYIFPGGMLPSPTALRNQIAQAGLSFVGSREFGLDYGRTLRQWQERFAAAWPKIEPLGFDTRFRRLWHFYLAYCEAGFNSANTDVTQVTLARA